jgi:hypothetical protein
VYVDGFNLYYGALKGTSYKWLDLGALIRILLPRDHVNRIRYFTARVSARPNDPQQPLRQDVYLRALNTIPNLSIHYGRFQVNPVRMPLVRPGRRVPMAWVVKTEEKGSDVNLASYLLLDAFKNDCEVAVIISNDADLRAPIDIARGELGMMVGVVNPHPPRKRSRDLQPDFFKQLRKGALKKSQFPSTILSPGRKLFKPTGW